MQRHFRPREVSVDQAGIGEKVAESSLLRGGLSQLQENPWHVRPRLACLRIVARVAITAAVSGPAQGATTAQGDRHGKPARRDHLPKRCRSQHSLECRQQTFQPGQGKASQYV